MLKIQRTGRFNQQLDELCFEDLELAMLVSNLIALFQKNPEDTRLDNHPLRKPMEGRWAFSVTDDIRIVYKWTNKTTARFLDIGPHTKVYVKANAKKQSPKR